MAGPTALSFLGVAKETVKGNGVTPSNYIPLKTIDPLDKVEYFPVEVLQGAMTDLYGEVQGYKYTEFGVAGPVFADSVGWMLGGVLGDSATATGSRTVADGVTTNLSAGITSASAAFTQNDVGRPLATANFPANSFILSVQSATAATMNVAATASGCTQSFVIGNAATFMNTFGLLNSGTVQPTSATSPTFSPVLH